ncbi:MAG TPA: hypothetical protein EYO72_06845, partial [Marine Group III euryarchaeote]|nr:hypothetical protein [Marine Group III euryarchaeote]
MSGDLYNLTIPHIGENDVVYKLSLEHVNNNDPDEYFLISNRQRWGYDSYLPASGLLIWHIDDGQSSNSDDGHRLVDLEVMSNMGSGGPWVNNSDGFTDSSSPSNSKSYGGDDSGYSVVQIGASGYNMMFVMIHEEGEWSYGSNLRRSSISENGEYIIAGGSGSSSNRIQIFRVSESTPLISY